MSHNILEKQINQLYNFSERTDNFGLSDLIKSVYNNGILGQEKLLTFLINRNTNKNTIASWIDGLIFELLLESPFSKITNMLKNSLPYGVIPLYSELQINYKPLLELLINNKFQEANNMTQDMLYQLSKRSNNNSRYWLYFSDIYTLPNKDLKTIDKLWQVHSKGLFGLSVQKNIWKANQQNWYHFYKTIKWINSENFYRRYPEEFIWDNNAPAGHLPLFNQIRGHHVLEALFTDKL